MIKTEIRNAAGIITLNRPEKRNALHPEMVDQLKNSLERFEADKNIKSIILTGEGKSFCSGADLAYLKDLRKYSSLENEQDSKLLADLFLKIYGFSKPVIAAVNGAAIAGGCGLATVCDYIVADSAHAKFGYTEVKIGFMPAVVSIFLIKKIGEGRAAQLLLSGDIVDAGEALRLGLVYSLSENVIDDSVRLAEKINTNSPGSVKYTKKMIRAISSLNVEEAVDYCIRLNAISRSTEDFINGINKFLNE